MDTMDFFVSRVFYRQLLRLYPAPFREAHGAEMESVWVASLRMLRKKRGPPGIALGWLRVLADTAWHSLKLRLGRRGEVRGGPSPGPDRMGGLGQALCEDGRSALRHLRRNPAFTLTAVGTLALGIGLNTAVFGAVYSLLLRPLPGVEAPEELVQIYRSRGTGAEFLPSSMPLVQDLRENGEPFSGLAAWTFAPLSVAVGDRVERVMAQVVSPEFFQVLGVTMIRGRGFSDPGSDGSDGGRVLVVSEDFWRSRMGGSSGAIGSTLTINGAPWEIIGVAPEAFRGPMPVLASTLWAPLSHHAELMRSGDQSLNRGNNFLDVVARLEPGVGLDQAREWAGALISSLAAAHPGYHENTSLRLHPQSRAGIHPGVRSAQIGLSGVLLGVVGLLLIVACVNVGGLFLAKAQARGTELTVRRRLGAPRRRLVSQLLLESLLLSLLAGGVGCLLAMALLGVLNGVRLPIPWAQEWNLALDGPVLVFTIVVTLVTSLVFGLAPALRATRQDLAPFLTGGRASRGERHARAGRFLVGAQVAVSTVLVVFAGLFARNLRNAMEVETGFRVEGLALATMDLGLHGYDGARTGATFRELAERIRSLPGVRSVGMARFLPMDVDVSQRLVEVPGHQPSPGESMNLRYNVVGPGYFDAMGIPVLAGRGFHEDDWTLQSGAAVVNQRFADRFWPGTSPLGRTFSGGGREWEVVGVVPTGKYRTLGEDPTAYMYLPWGAFRSSVMTFHIRVEGDPAAIFPHLRSEVEAVAPGVPLYGGKTMESHLAFALFPARISALLLGIVGALCLLLLSVGIHGVVALSVRRRSREVGIRTAVGADPASATKLVFGQEIRVVAVGLLIGLAGAVAASQVAESLLYSGEATDPLVLVGAPLFLMMTAAVASYLPARWAARLDPARVLREE